MKKILVLVMFLTSLPLFAGAGFSAKLINNGTYLSIHLSDNHPIPPFEAGELWKVIVGRDQLKMIREKELEVSCNAVTTRANDTIGECTILMPFEQFTKIGKLMVFKAEGQLAARLNRHFLDSTYYSIQGNQVYLNSKNTRRLFYFGINEELIQR